MKAKLAVLISLIIPCLVQAVPVDFGPSGVVREPFRYRYITGVGLDNVPLAGQTLALDFTFGAHFVRAFTVTPDLLFSLGVDLDGGYLFPPDSNISQQLSLGSGYFTDANGQRIGEATPLFGYYGSGSYNRPGNALTNMQIYAETDFPSRPIDLYGFHFDLTLPTIDAFITEDGNPNGWNDAYTTYAYIAAVPTHTRPHPVFGIGPDIPRDITVPDSGATLLLLGLALSWLVGFARVPV